MEKNLTADALRVVLEEFVSSYPSKTSVRAWWRTPLLSTAEADERFRVLRKIVSDEHLLPWHLLPSGKTVIVFFLPFVKELIEENRPGKFPCRDWGLAYEETNDLIGLLGKRIKDYLVERGYRSALTAATHNFDERKLVSKWSHKHLGHLSGLGRFGVNAQLITPVGCAGRLGSLVTEAELGDNPLVGSYEPCLHKAGQECLKCLEGCPVGAVREEGIDRQRCYARLKFNLARSGASAGLKETTHVCGKCTVGLPCSFDPPVGHD